DLMKRGAVKLTVKQIKAMAPSEAFLSTNEHDEVLVEFPLNEILPRLRPEHLAHRAGQQHLFVPDDTSVIFGPTGSVNGAVRISASPGVNRAPSVSARAAEQQPEPARQIRPSISDN